MPHCQSLAHFPNLCFSGTVIAQLIRHSFLLPPDNIPSRTISPHFCALIAPSMARPSQHCPRQLYPGSSWLHKITRSFITTLVGRLSSGHRFRLPPSVESFVRRFETSLDEPADQMFHLSFVPKIACRVVGIGLVGSGRLHEATVTTARALVELKAGGLKPN
jgi:hypothetical protein